MQTDVGIAHIAVNLCLRYQCGDGVNDYDIDSSGPDHGLRDLQCLLAAVRLGNIEVVDVDADILGIDRIQCVLSINESRNSAPLLHFSDHVERHCCLTGRLRSVDLNDPALGNAAQSESNVKAQGSCGDRLNIHLNGGISELHNSSLTVLFLDLQECCVQCLLLLFIIYTHLISSKLRTFVLVLV